MKEKTLSPFYIRKYYILTLLACLCSLFFCAAWGFSLLKVQHEREHKQIGNIAGAVLSQYPESESTLISALQDTHYSHTDAGYAILYKYGYRQNVLTDNNAYYPSVFTSFISLLALMVVGEITLITVCFFQFNRAQKRQEQQLHTLLDSYLTEDYAIPETTKSFNLIFNESFTDTLLKLGNKLMAKTRALTEERDHTKTLVTDISHQLKTPVSALKSCFAMCMEADSEEERADFLQRCALQMNKLENLVAELINISRLETFMISLHRETILLSDLLTDAVNTVYEKALQKEISIGICEPDEKDVLCIPLLVDRHWTAEAIANILDNAVKYSPAESTIDLHIYKFYSYVQLEIADHGIGIPKDEANQIFKRFYRGSHPAVKQSEGAGVGLYLTRWIMEEQGGAVTVKSAVGQGSVFCLRFPI